ncbi:hypothetical protein CLOSTHATH_00315 [Hungatella hathewayi DSM 13479]|uniref:Uncharacterized protein n=1 Tax=Hungatella hathewayi DSM 13479 TaxID=566550 RepID=D3A9P4_9FIRM|nr:hypothetical protein CLOSTHATH_00315 [Hungatella hathewayi DSM 13479]
MTTKNVLNDCSSHLNPFISDHSFHKKTLPYTRKNRKMRTCVLFVSAICLKIVS